MFLQHNKITKKYGHSIVLVVSSIFMFLVIFFRSFRMCGKITHIENQSSAMNMNTEMSDWFSRHAYIILAPRRKQQSVHASD